MLRVIGILITFMFASICGLWAQPIDDLPELLPSYTEDFSDFKSNPSMCFDKVFLDGFGRMWLTPCTGTQTGLHLFQFDGYEFTATRGIIDELPTNTRFVLMDDQERLVGYVNKPGHHQVVIYAPLNDNLLTYNLPSTEETDEIIGVFVNENDALVVFTASENFIHQYEQEGNEFTIARQAIKEVNKSVDLVDVLGDKEDGIWYWSTAYDKLHQSNIFNSEKKTFTLSGVELPANVKKEDRPFIGKLFPSEGSYYLSLTNMKSRRSKLLKQDLTRGRFIAVEGLPSNAQDITVFNDESGNVVFLFLLPQNKYLAILEDHEGKRYNYSAFFASKLSLGPNLYIKSPDFKQQVMICHSQGIILHTVKASDALIPILPQHSIRAMTELPGQKTLITTQESDIKFIYDNRTGQVKPWVNSRCNMAWAKLIQDKAGYVWGIDPHYLIKYDPINDTCAHYPIPLARNVFTLVGEDSIAFTSEGHLAFFDLIKKETNFFKVNDQPLKISGFVHDILYSRSGDLWMSTSKGMVKVNIQQKTAEVIGMKEPFLDFRFLSIHEDEKGWLWLGTPLGGIHLYNPTTSDLKILNSEDGLANNTVVSIVADDDGDRWVGTYNGISIVSPDGVLMANLYVDDGLVNREANRYAYLKTGNGKLLIGTVNGLNVIEPRKVKQQMAVNRSLSIYLTSISYFNANENSSVNQRYGLDQLETLTLPASHRNLQMKFAISNYFKPEYNQYAYQLEGISDEWIAIGNQNSLNLNNLPAGRYRLLIKGSDGTGNWTARPIVIPIHAREYFYKQAWFYLFGLAIVVGLAYLWINRLRSEVKKATKTILKDKEIIEEQAEKLLELDRAKSRFFTNISHEFRTPLTVIYGMIDQISDAPELWLHKGARMIKQNTENLLNLVNQLLDLRKLESKELKVQMVQGNVVKYLHNLIQSYQIYAQSKGLQLHFLPAVDQLIMDYDPEKMLRILSNLLSNAMKYTPVKGHIYFHVNQFTEKGHPMLQLRVEDTGAGIPGDQLPHVFERFYQADNPTTRRGEGTGIGLALTKELVTLMGGTIGVKSIQGKGTAFTVSLPITNDSPVLEVLPEVLHSVDLPRMDRRDVRLADEVKSRPDKPAPSGQLPTLLIVEDNPDIQQFLVVCLEKSYQLETANNGREGVDIALEKVPDLIISDVMMPEKNGFELCETLKNDERTSHIPIILLTAKADQESRISGLRTGADAYLNKPFEREELMVRLEKLFELRKKLQARYSLLGPEAVPENKEDEFVLKVRQAVLEHISDETFGIAQLCRAVSLSRAQLHNKLKALTGQSTSHFVRSIRLQKAKELLESTGMNVSEVAYEVGFKNLSHFSTIYLDAFGVSPSKTSK